VRAAWSFLAKDLTGRLFHTYAKQEVTLTGQTHGKHLVAFPVKNDPVVYFTARGAIAEI
jgi:hypothetical protein